LAYKRKSAHPEGQKFGLVPAKGISSPASQGCGKSLAAKAARAMGFDSPASTLGALSVDKFVGEKRKEGSQRSELAAEDALRSFSD